MAFGGRVWNLGRLLLIASGLLATYLVFAAVAVQVAVRARDVTVPDVTGTTLADASQRLAQVDLMVRVDTAQRPSVEVAAGHVLGQDPAAGTSSRRQRSVRIWLSAGPRIAYMPQLVGDTDRAANIRLSTDGLEPAASMLRQQGFRVSFVAQQSSSGLPPGLIVRQTPPGGHQVQPGAAISLEVAR